MPQMVLPQTPAPGMQNDNGSKKAGAGKEAGDGESRFESLSRAEQRRLDRQKTEHSDESQPVKEPRSAENDRLPPESGENMEAIQDVAETPGAAVATVADSVENGKLTPELSGDMELVATPLTFAELQTLLVPANGQAAAVAEGVPASKPGLSEGVPASKSGLSAVLAQMVPGSGPVNGVINGKPGLQGQGAPGATSGLQLTEALTASLAPDNARAADSSASLVASARVQSAMEVVSQQAANANAAKLSPEISLPLRGYATSIDVPVGHAEWGDKMVGKLSWLTARNMSVAEIHLTPPDMGPMEVKVRMHHDQANITVHAANPVVRDQLELNSHRLRDMLGEQGLSLAQFDVSDSPQQQGGEQATGDGEGSGGRGTSGTLADADLDDTDLRSGNLDLSWKGEVDIFA